MLQLRGAACLMLRMCVAMGLLVQHDSASAVPGPATPVPATAGVRVTKAAGAIGLDSVATLRGVRTMTVRLPTCVDARLRCAADAQARRPWLQRVGARMHRPGIARR